MFCVSAIKKNMADHFKHQYRIPSARLQGYDYGRSGSYFITICTKNRIHYLGEIIVETHYYTSYYASGGQAKQNKAFLRATPIGENAIEYWKKIPDHFPFVMLDEFQIM